MTVHGRGYRFCGTTQIFFMPKSKQQKQTTVEALTDGLKQAKSVVFANFQGLTVAATEELRKAARKDGVSMVAVKKTLVKRALESAGLTNVDTLSFQGGVATFMGSDEVTAAKVVNTFAKTHDVVSIFGGIMDGAFIDTAMVKTLAAIPGKKELYGKLVGTLNAPIQDFATVSAAVIRSLYTVLNAYKEKKA